MDGFEFLKSVGGGGRYDALASDGADDVPRRRHLVRRQSRSLVPLMSRGLLAADRKVPSAVLVAARRRGVAAPTATRSPPRCAPAASRARSAVSAQKFGKQIRYAERRGIPYVWFTNADGGHEVKDIRSGEQVAADPATWTPPTEDLRPQVLIKETEQ